jgi:hypothetical protein
MALHPIQVTIILLTVAMETTRLEVGRRHGAGGGEPHAQALIGGAIALA